MVLFSNQFFLNQKVTSTLMPNNQIAFTQMCASNCQPDPNTTCCQIDNCNSVNLTEKVSQCYVGGFYSYSNIIFSIPVAPKNCTSPQNQYCIVRMLFLLYFKII